MQPLLQPGNDGSEHLLEAFIATQIRNYYGAHSAGTPPAGVYARVMELVERPLLEETLRHTEGNQLRAADMLGINRNTLRKKMRELGIHVPDARRRTKKGKAP